MDAILQAVLAFLNSNPTILVSVLTAALMGLGGWLMGLLPRGEPGGAWDLVRTIINRVVGNIRNARNEPTTPASP